MMYLDILIGFSLVMLVFASAISVAQTLLKRLFAIKGKALEGPLLDELEKAWKANPALRGAADEAWQAVRSHLSGSMRGRADALGSMLRHVSINNVRQILSMVHSEALTKLEQKYHGEFARVLADVERRWDSIAGRLNASYETHTRRWVFAISAAAVLLFNVDAIRLVQVLSVNQATRDKLAAAGENALTDPALTGFQKANLEELQGAGVPIGWSKAPLVICPGDKHVAYTWHGAACGGWNAGETIFLWLVRLLGLLIGAGLIAQGAPFWYSVLDTVVGIKKKVKAEQPQGTTETWMAIAAAADEAVQKKLQVAAAGGQPAKET